MKQVKGVIRNVDVFENSDEQKIENELREGIAPHLLYECPHCEKVQVYFYKKPKASYKIPCDDCMNICEVIL